MQTTKQVLSKEDCFYRIAKEKGYPSWQDYYDWVAREGQRPDVVAQLIEAATIEAMELYASQQHKQEGLRCIHNWVFMPTVGSYYCSKCTQVTDTLPDESLSPQQSADAVEFAEWIEKNDYWAETYQNDGTTRRPCIVWSNDSASPQHHTTTELCQLFLKSKNK